MWPPYPAPTISAKTMMPLFCFHMPRSIPRDAKQSRVSQRSLKYPAHSETIPQIYVGQSIEAAIKRLTREIEEIDNFVYKFNEHEDRLLYAGCATSRF